MHSNNVLTFELMQVSKESDPSFTAKRAEIVGGLVKKAITEADSKYGFLLRDGGQVRVVLGLSGHVITTGDPPENMPQDPIQRQKSWGDAGRAMIREMNLLTRYGLWAAEINRIERITDTEERNKAIVKLMHCHGVDIPGTKSGSMHRVIGRCFNIKKYEDSHAKLFNEFKVLTKVETPATQAEDIQVKRIETVTAETPVVVDDEKAADELLTALENAAGIASFTDASEGAK